GQQHGCVFWITLQQVVAQFPRANGLADHAQRFDQDQRDLTPLGAARGLGGQCFFKLADGVGILSGDDILPRPRDDIVGLDGHRQDGAPAGTDENQRAKNGWRDGKGTIFHGSTPSVYASALEIDAAPAASVTDNRATANPVTYHTLYARGCQGIAVFRREMRIMVTFANITWAED